MLLAICNDIFPYVPQTVHYFANDKEHDKEGSSDERDCPCNRVQQRIFWKLVVQVDRQEKKETRDGDWPKRELYNEEKRSQPRIFDSHNFPFLGFLRKTNRASLNSATVPVREQAGQTMSSGVSSTQGMKALHRGQTKGNFSPASR